MRNPKLEAVVEGLGGLVATAYHCGRSVTTVYQWINQGHVLRLRDALKLQAAAEAAGHPVTLAELAGHEPGSSAKRKRAPMPAAESAVE